jgi:hypothetical protein
LLGGAQVRRRNGKIRPFEIRCPSHAGTAAYSSGNATRRPGDEVADRFSYTARRCYLRAGFSHIVEIAPAPAYTERRTRMYFINQTPSPERQRNGL